MQKTLGGPLEDYALTTQAKVVFELGRLHIKKALKTELINSGRYSPIPTYYSDTEDGNTEALKKFLVDPDTKNLLKGCRLAFTSSERFLRANKYEPFVFLIAFFNPDSNKRTNNWKGSFSQQGISKLPTITLYCPYEPPKRTSFGFLQANEVAQALVSGLNVNTQELRSTFIHEFGHNYNFLQWKEKNKGKVPFVKYNSPPDKSRSEDSNYEDKYKRYINDYQEINSQYLEWIHAIQDSFNRLLRIKDAEFNMRKAFPTFHDFWDFYWTTPGFVPTLLQQMATPKTEKRLARRLANFYQFLVDNPVSSPKEVEDFIKKDMEVDYNSPNY